MLSYLEKFNKLPQELKDKISSPEAMQAIGEIEKKYKVSLATIVMRLMVKDVSMVDLAKYFVFEHSLDARQAEQLVEELKSKVFLELADYLSFIKEETRDKNKLDSWMDSKRQGTAVRGSNFFFSPEDEEEVKELAKKVQSFVDGSQPTAQIEEKVNQLIKQANINFSSEELFNRFKQVLKTYLKGIRNKIDTRETLGKSVETGGLGMEANVITTVLMAADKIKQRPEDKSLIKPPAKMKLPEDKPVKEAKEKKEGELLKQDQGQKSDKEAKMSEQTVKSLKESGVRDMEYDFSKLSSSPPRTTKHHERKSVDEYSKTSVATSQDYGRDSEMQGSSKTSKIAPAGLEPEKKEKTETQSKDMIGSPKLSSPKEVTEGAKSDITSKPISPINIRRPQDREAGQSGQAGKVKMEDVKYVPKLMGPIDELREMDLVNFRRLSQDPATAADKIKEKLKILEDENYGQKLSGIKAWRQSPVNKLYLTIGQESMGHKKPVNIIIEEKKTANQDYLTDQEFTAIMDLNKSLRF
jgi:hypothetical protein